MSASLPVGVRGPPCPRLPTTVGRRSQEPSYEQARDELVQIVAQLEAGVTTLEQSLALWQRGEDLANLCERYRDAARVRWTTRPRRGRHRRRVAAAQRRKASGVSAPADGDIAEQHEAANQ